MQTRDFVFQSNQPLFKQYLMPVLHESPEYKSLNETLDKVLLLGDRVLEAYRDDLHFNRVSRVITKLLTETNRNLDVDDTQIEQLLGAMEIWLKALHRLVHPKRWEKLQNSKRYTLFPVIRELELLTQRELEMKDESELYEIKDEVKKLILIAKVSRDTIAHYPNELSLEYKLKLFPATLAILLAPLYKHFALINQRLKGLMIRELQKDTQVISLIKTVSSERTGHLTHFAGREQWIKKLVEKLHSPDHDREYILLTGAEGIGKSALCSKLSVELAQNLEVFGSQAGTVQKLAPWLPGVLLHFGKQSNQPIEIVKSIVIQANTLLLNPMNLQDNINWLQRESRLASEHLEGYQRILYQVLDQVVQERGEVIVIIDALDEVSKKGEKLEFLPKILPVGVRVLLTARSGTLAEFWLENNRKVEKIHLAHLSRREIPLLTKIEDKIGEKAKAFNDQVWKESSGWPLIISQVAREVRRNQGDFQSVEIEGNIDNVFRRQGEEWLSAHPKEADNLVLKEILLLLAIFEPANPLEMVEIQGYLEHLGTYLDQPELQKKLKPVAYQVAGLDVNRLTLKFNVFAEFIRTKYITTRDLRRKLKIIVEWLATDDEIPMETVAGFLQYWTDESTVGDTKCCQIAASLVEQIRDQLRIDLLSQMAEFWRDTGVYSEISNTCLRFAAEAGKRSAMAIYGSALLDGEGINQNLEEGEKWIRKAVELGDTKAMVNLGERLLDNYGLKEDREEGEKLLREAVKLNEPLAMAELGHRLIEGYGVQQDVAEGERLLRKAAVLGDRWAMMMLGHLMIVGLQVKKNLIEGEKWLRKAAELGYRMAMGDLGTFLIRGQEIKANRVEGEKWLRKAVELGDRWAMAILGSHLLDGYGIKESIVEGEMWLRKSAMWGHRQGMAFLGDRLLDGNGVPQDSEAGENWLRKAANEGKRFAMVLLGIRLLDGDAVRQDQVEGERWLRKAVADGERIAMAYLGKRLLLGDGVPKNEKEGLELLRKSVESGLKRGMIYLGEYLIRNSEREGEQLLRKSVENGERRGMTILGNFLLDGIHLVQNLAEGEKWLRQAAQYGDRKGMVSLGQRLLDGNGISKNLEEGEKWLRKAATRGERAGMTALGIRLIEGNGLTQDELEGCKWLQKAASRGHRLAQEYLLNQQSS